MKESSSPEPTKDAQPGIGPADRPPTTTGEKFKQHADELGRANDTQEGGRHYKMPGYEEHWDRAWRLDYDCFQYIITKWVERWKDKGGIEDLKKAQHSITKYIEVVEAKEASPGAPRMFKHPNDWTPEEQRRVAETVLKHNPLLRGLNQSLGRREVKEDEVRIAMDRPVEDNLDRIEKFLRADDRALTTYKFTYEGGTNVRDEWTCKNCNEHIWLDRGVPPEDNHTCSAPSRRYVNQDPDPDLG